MKAGRQAGNQKEGGDILNIMHQSLHSEIIEHTRKSNNNMKECEGSR